MIPPRATRIAWCLILLLGLLPPFLQAGIADVSWPLYLAERMLGGARQGVDFFEVNPPLFLWLAIPPVLLHRITGLGVWHANVIWVAVLGVSSLMLSARVLRLGLQDDSQRAWVLLACAFCVFLLPADDFGQREHIALLGVIPFVLLSAARLHLAAVPASLAVVTGVYGGIGFALKPFFLPAWLVLEAMLATRLGARSLRRPELLALVGTGALYGGIVLLTFPEYLEMAVRLAGPYSRYIQNPFWIVLGLGGPVLLLMAAVAPSLRAQGADRDNLRTILWLAFAGFLAGAVLQRKGFSYHFLPAWAFGYLMLVRAAQTLPGRLSWQPSGMIVRAGLVLLVALPVWWSVSAARALADGERSPGNPDYEVLLPVVRSLTSGGPILVLSSSPAFAWPLVPDAGGTWPLRYMSLWPLPALYDHELGTARPRIVAHRNPATRTGFERRFNEEVLQDITREPPEVIIVPVVDSTIPAWAIPQRFDYLRYFGDDPRFGALFAQYREAARPGSFIVLKRGGS